MQGWIGEGKSSMWVKGHKECLRNNHPVAGANILFTFQRAAAQREITAFKIPCNQHEAKSTRARGSVFYTGVGGAHPAF
ncbi:rCG43080 [Rattus norvegicus]|uniref:RCG43080 n=1 Tax=Rattus norvegicus TaxID=10116 RepID=A6IVX7_RAT|nr:rCG43080 [Rattus norvegicus]